MRDEIKREWGIRLQTILWFFLILGFLTSLLVLLNWPALYIYIFIFSVLIALPIAWLLGRFCTSHKSNSFKENSIRSTLGSFLFFSSVFALPFYYFAFSTELNPKVFPQVTLTNGEKTVILQGMQHVASENFYKSVIYDIEKAFSQGYVLFYEAVQQETPESQEYFKKITRAITGQSGELDHSYELLGVACGLKVQKDFFKVFDADKEEHPERHIIADVDALELKDEYERLMKSDSNFAKEYGNVFDVPEAKSNEKELASLIKWLKEGGEGKQRLAGIICRGSMTLTASTKVPLEPVILDFRNRELAKDILNSSNQKIFVTYGAKHLPGVIEILKEKDSHWKIISTKWMRTIENPNRKYEGKL